MEIDDATRKRIETVLPMLDESQARRYVAAETESLGYGGVTVATEAAGVSRATVTAGKRELGRMLESTGFSLQGNRKNLQVGRLRPDRDAQFRHLNGRCAAMLADGLPMVSVYCKKHPQARLVGSLRCGK